MNYKLFWGGILNIRPHSHTARELSVSVIPLDDFANSHKLPWKGRLHDRQILLSKLKVGISHMLILDLNDNHLIFSLDEKESVRLTVLYRGSIVREEGKPRGLYKTEPVTLLESPKGVRLILQSLPILRVPTRGVQGEGG